MACVHARQLVALLFGPYVPPAQEVHAVWPYPVENFPDGHALQLEDPVYAVVCAGPHNVQTDAEPPRENVPNAQSEQMYLIRSDINEPLSHCAWAGVELAMIIISVA